MLEAALPKEERFKGQHVLGWMLGIFSILLMAGALIYGGWDGIRRGFAYWQFFIRFAIMVLLVKAFDICFFDWGLLCRSNFFPTFYPETAHLLGQHLFGYNKKSHVVQIVVFLAIAAVLAGICAVL